jgi:hypothetical protein
MKNKKTLSFNYTRGTKNKKTVAPKNAAPR